MKNSNWTHDALFAKAKIYMERALNTDRNASLFPFWASLALELIGRSTLSKIHPALIADPREGSNILHAFGFGTNEFPKTIGAKTVFLRLQIIIPEFTNQEEKFCQSFINMRNEELHTGTPIFEDYSTNLWLTPFYRVIKILLVHQGKTLEDLIGNTEAVMADKMISEYKEGIVSKVKEKIKKYKDVFNELDEDEKNKRKKRINIETLTFVHKELINDRHKQVVCPSCANDALLYGEFISKSEPQVYKDKVKIHRNILPTEFRCFCCGLKISGNGELTAIEHGGQFSIEQCFDPVEYYDIKYDPIEELKNRGYSWDEIKEELDDEFIYDDYGND